jgi:hypothetical protein
MVSEDGRRASRTASHFNWLDDYDEKARDFEQARDWMEYSFFAFARFPRLRPADKNSFCTTGRQWFEKALAHYDREISRHTKANRALHDLSDDQRLQLAALLSDCMAALEKFARRHESKEMFRDIASAGPGKGRKLRAKYRDASQALESLVEHCRKAGAVVNGDFRQRAGQALRVLREAGSPQTPDGENVAAVRDELGLITRDPTTELMVRLYWFFCSGCNVSGHEAEVRTGLIRNAFWSQQDVPTVAVNEAYRPGESAGCDAVKQAVRRFKL